MIKEEREYAEGTPPSLVEEMLELFERMLKDARERTTFSELIRKVEERLEERIGERLEQQVNRIREELVEELRKGERRGTLIDITINGFFFVLGIVAGSLII